MRLRVTFLNIDRYRIEKYRSVNAMFIKAWFHFLKTKLGRKDAVITAAFNDLPIEPITMDGSGDFDLNQAAIDSIVIESCGACVGKIAWNDLHSFSYVEKYPFSDWQSLPKAIYRYRLQNVVLDAYYMVFFKDGKTVSNSNHFVSGDLLNSLQVRQDSLISVTDQDVVFSCFDHWTGNYYHWIAHAIPAFFAAKQSNIKGKFLIPSPLRAWQLRTLELLGIDLSLCYSIERDKQYLFPTLDYYEFATGEADFIISDLSVKAYTQMVANVKQPGSSELQHDKIYISRLNKEHRHLDNEAELVEALKGRGYFILNPEEFSIDEQIIIFQNTKIVVALLGAGLSNIVFCKPETIIYELIPSHHQNPCFLKISVQGKLRYWADNFDTGVDHNQPDHLSSWLNHLDVGFVVQRLDTLEQFINNT